MCSQIKSLLFYFIFVLFFFSCVSKERRYEVLIKEGNKAFKQGLYKKTIDKMSKAIKINNNSLEAHILNGRANYEVGDYQESFDNFNTAINIDSTNTVPYFYCGIIMYDRDDFNKAIYFLNKAINTKGSDSLYFEQSSNLFELIGEEIITMGEIRFFRGLCYYYLAKPDDAIADLQFSLDNEFDSCKCYKYLYLAWLSKGVKKTACEYLELLAQKKCKNLEDIN